jgi:hypothetical protein
MVLTWIQAPRHLSLIRLNNIIERKKGNELTSICTLQTGPAHVWILVYELSKPPMVFHKSDTKSVQFGPFVVTCGQPRGYGPFAGGCASNEPTLLWGPRSSCTDAWVLRRLMVATRPSPTVFLYRCMSFEEINRWLVTVIVFPAHALVSLAHSPTPRPCFVPKPHSNIQGRIAKATRAREVPATRRCVWAKEAQ